MDHTWYYEESPVNVDIKSPTMLECLPNGKHSRYIQIALNRLSWLPLALPTSVTVSNLPWQINAIVAPNDDQTPVWKAQRQHQQPDVPESEVLSPFIYIDRSKKTPMTRALTFELARAEDGDFIVTDVYAGSRIPPLPWQVSDMDDGSLLRESIAFWKKNSFLRSGQLVSGKQEYPAPSWTKCQHAISL